VVNTDHNSEKVAPCCTPDRQCMLVRFTAAGSLVTLPYRQTSVYSALLHLVVERQWLSVCRNTN